MLVTVDWQTVAGGQPPGGMLRFTADAAARIWPDPADARFAAEIGVPYSRGLFRILGALAERDPASRESAFATGIEPVPVDTPQGKLQPLGELFQSTVYVRLDDGTIWVSDPDAEVEYELIHQDLSSLAYLVYKVEVERPGPDERPTPRDWAAIDGIIRTGMRRWDQLPFEDEEGFWERYLDSYPML